MIPDESWFYEEYSPKTELVSSRDLALEFVGIEEWVIDVIWVSWDIWEIQYVDIWEKWKKWDAYLEELYEENWLFPKSLR